MQRVLLLSILLLHTCHSLEESASGHRWIKEGVYYKLYGMYLEDFIKEHPKTLVVIYDTSTFAQTVLSEIESIHTKLAQKGLKLNLAKLFHGDSERHVINWNVRQFPHLRLFVGEEVYSDLNMFPSSTNVLAELNKILSADQTITEIYSQETKEVFLHEKLAFYLRFPKNQPDWIYLLEKIQQLDSTVKVYYTHDPLLDPFSSHKPNDLVVGFRRNFDDPIRFIASDHRLDRQSILSFYHAYRIPDVRSLDEELLYDIFSRKIRSVVFFDEESASQRISDFKRVAFQHKNTFLFVLADSSSAVGQELLPLVKAEKGSGDFIRIIDFREKDVDVYAVEADDYDVILKGVARFNSGSLEPITDGSFIDGEL